MNGKELAGRTVREMQAIIAYIKFLGKGTPEGVRVPGMGLFPIAGSALGGGCHARAEGLCRALRALPQG